VWREGAMAQERARATARRFVGRGGGLLQNFADSALGVTLGLRLFLFQSLHLLLLHQRVDLVALQLRGCGVTIMELRTVMTTVA